MVAADKKGKKSKKSKTTLGMWAENNGFMYADKRIPDEWIE